MNPTDSLARPPYALPAPHYELERGWDGFFTGSKYLPDSCNVFHDGMRAEEVPYFMAGDTLVTVLLLVAIFVLLFILSRSLSALLIQAQLFFSKPDKRKGDIVKSDSETRMPNLISLVISCLGGLLFFNLYQRDNQGLFGASELNVILLVQCAIVLLYFIFKFLAHGITNWTFFSAARQEAWRRATQLILFAEALALFPLILAVIYLDVDTTTLLLTAAIVVGVLKILTLWKTWQVFFSYKFGQFHLLLYFCTLEIVPLCVLWISERMVTDYLTTYL